jgi:hypothetical protein
VNSKARPAHILASALLALALLAAPMSAIAQGDSQPGNSRHDMTLLLRAAQKYCKAHGTFPYFDSDPVTALKKAAALLSKTHYLKEAELKGEKRKGYGLAGFFLPMPEKLTSPLLLLVQQKLAKNGDLLIALTNGQIVTLNKKNPQAIKQFIPRAYLTNKRMKTNEKSAIAVLRALTSAQVIFREADKDKNGKHDYGTLAQLIEANMIASQLRSGRRQGYLFKVWAGHSKDKTEAFLWSAVATPENKGVTGLRSFYVDQTTTIRVSDSGPANAKSPVLGAQKTAQTIKTDREKELQGGSLEGNEKSAIESLRILLRSQAAFRKLDKDGNGIINYGQLDQLLKAKLIGRSLGTGTKAGYLFKIKLGAAGDRLGEYLWSATATPIETGKTGQRSFFIDQSGAIRYSNKGAANGTSPTLGSD